MADFSIKSILVVNNAAGDGATAFARDLATSMNLLKPAAVETVAVDYSGGELWRQASLQDGFNAYSGEVFDAAVQHYLNRARHTMPENNITDTQAVRLERYFTESNHLQVVMDSKASTASAARVSIVILIARCDPRNLSRLRAHYQHLLRVNPNTYVVLTQGAEDGEIGKITGKLLKGITDKKVQTLNYNGAPLVVPFKPDAYTLAAREGLPVFRVSESERVTHEDIRFLRSIHHEAAVEIRRILVRSEMAREQMIRATRAVGV